jgi:hypothetical protein
VANGDRRVCGHDVCAPQSPDLVIMLGIIAFTSGMVWLRYGVRQPCCCSASMACAIHISPRSVKHDFPDDVVPVHLYGSFIDASAERLYG